MHSFRAWREGIRRVASAPALVAMVWAATTLVSVPLTLAIRSDVVRSLDRSMNAVAAARGLGYEWMREYDAHASGVAATVRPTITGFGAVLDNLSAYLDNVQRPSPIAAATGVYVLVWTFLTGGLIDRYAGNPRRATHIGEFLSACARYFFRFVRLAIVTAIVYGVLFGVVHRWLFAGLYPRLIDGVALDRNAFAVRVTLYVVFVLLLAAANIVFDFAKVRAVVEDRRSILVALAASWRYIRRHPRAALGVYSLDAIGFATVLVVYSAVAPAAGGTGAMVWAAVAIGQVYVVGRLSVRLLFFASETALFQQRHD